MEENEGNVKQHSYPRNCHSCVKSSLLVILALLPLLLSFPASLWAKPMSSEQAKKAVKGWLKVDPNPLNTQLGNQVGQIDTFADNQGEPIYYVIYLQPSGFVITPADDLVEPIVAFADDGTYDPSPDNPLGAMVSRDLPGRVAAARDLQKAIIYQKKTKLTEQQAALEQTCLKAQSKWAELNDYYDTVAVLGVSSISDVWVAPLVQSKWSQSTESGKACYNYYTPGPSYPPIDPNDTDNYVCGCVATAMAQYMRYWQYPTTGVGTGGFTIHVDDYPYTEYLRGGNGSGGPYNWSDMVLDPDSSITGTEREAIGALTFDAGVAANMDYSSGGSGATMYAATTALRTTFLYNNAICAYDFDDGIAYDDRNNMINTNLDWGNPSLLGVSRPGGAHAILADGYGYDSATLYHHINMGWGGGSDAWYNLPTILTYDTVDAIVYNIYISGSDEIISGRVTDSSGNPLSGATVTGERTGGGTYNDTTDSNGIYALAKIPSSSSYTISVTKSGYNFTNQNVTTGLSDDFENTSGNRWGNDFVGTLSGQPIAYPGIISTQKGVAVAIDLQAVDDGLPNPPGVLSYIITSLPSHGTLNDPGAGDINSVPYTLASYGNQVVYTPTSGYSGSDNFTFKANDGGVPPNGGDSNIATISISVFDAIYMADMNTDPCWTTEGLWAFGIPTGGGSYCNDPTSGYTGNNVYGYNLNGDYSNNMPAYRLTTTAIDCTDYQNITLSFWRWLGVESSSFDHAKVEVSNNGSTWTTIWNHTGSAICDGAWIECIYDISAVADSQPTVYLRWTMGTTDSTVTYPGWNIDDVKLTGDSLQPQPPVAQAGSDSTQNDTSILITLSATDDGLPNPPGDLNYIITSMPGHGSMDDPSAGAIYIVPYILADNGNQVVYTPCASYAGSDSFTFKANDSGTAPEGGDSNIETITINIQAPVPSVIYETNFDGGLPSGWTIIDYLSDGYTWTTENDYIPWTGTFMVVGYEYTAVDMDEELITHSIDCSDLIDVTLNFKHILDHYSDETADVDVRVGGGSWQNIARYLDDADETVTLDISSIADGQSNVQIRWHYYNADWEWYWGIDDVNIVATEVLPEPMLGDFEPDCDVDFRDYGILASAWLSSPENGNWNPLCDISDPNDNFIDEWDIEVFTENWLIEL